MECYGGGRGRVKWGEHRFWHHPSEIFEVVLGLLAVTIWVTGIEYNQSRKSHCLFKRIPLPLFTGCFWVLPILSYPARVFTSSISEEIIAVSLLFCASCKKGEKMSNALYQQLRPCQVEDSSKLFLSNCRLYVSFEQYVTWKPKCQNQQF